MTQKTSFFTIITVLLIGFLFGCKKDNNGNETPDIPIVAQQVPSIDEFMPERLLQLFDSLNVLHRGDNPPTINGSFMTELMNLPIVDKVPESNYMGSPTTLPIPHYYEFYEQNDAYYHLKHIKPTGTPGEPGFFIEQFDTDSTYSRIKDKTALFANDPIAPPYFKSSNFTAEDFKYAYIIGNGDYFTLYFYEIRDISSGYLPLNAILISGKMSTDTEGNPTIENFWCGRETMKYFGEGESLNTIIHFGLLPTPGDIIVIQCPNVLVQGSYN